MDLACYCHRFEFKIGPKNEIQAVQTQSPINEDPPVLLTYINSTNVVVAFIKDKKKMSVINLNWTSWLTHSNAKAGSPTLNILEAN